MKATHRATFGGQLGAVLVTAGSAVGLGNIWRFPYVAGENGGAAFLLIYVLSVLLIGVPIMLAEFAIGRHTHSNAVGAYRMLSGHWTALGYNSVIAPLLIMGFYLVVSGWTMEYMIHSLTGEFTRVQTVEEYAAIFSTFTQNPWRPAIYTVIFTLLTHGVIALGVQKGIERSSRIMMPLLMVILVILAIHSILLPGGMQGVKFLFTPDFSKVTASTFLTALGQAFFSLSIGLGCLVTYASYFKDDTNITHTALQVVLIDTLVAVLAGVVIFPAVFSVGIEPTAGPSLVFVTLPAIFNTLPLSMVWSTIFFLLLVIAALTSTISLHEVLTAYIHEEWHLSRRISAWIVTAACSLLGVAASLSLGAWKWLQIGGKSLFDLLDFVTANVLLPAGGFFICIFAGWVLDRRFMPHELTNKGTIPLRLWPLLQLLLRWVCPALLLLIFLDNLGLI